MFTASGAVYPFGNAASHGSAATTALRAPIVGMATTPAGGGYWLVAADGGVFTFGDATFHGSLGEVLNKPIVGMDATPTAAGTGSLRPTVVSSVRQRNLPRLTRRGTQQAHRGHGRHPRRRRVLARCGRWRRLQFGDAAFYGSLGAQHLNKPVVGMRRIRTAAGTGSLRPTAACSVSAMRRSTVRPEESS